MDLCLSENSIVACGKNECCKECNLENCILRCCDFQAEVDCEFRGVHMQPTSL